MIKTVTRLDAPMGLLINRSKPLSFTFEGVDYQGYEGDSIASSLLANDRWLMSRSFKYHRPRGPLTMAGHDANTLVQWGGEPNVLADRELLTSGMALEGQNYAGSLDNDRDALLGYFGRFMPVGFYYRAFYKPLGVWDKWEKQIRKKSGLGKLDLSFKPEYYDKEYLFYDVVIIGAGPAGLSAAIKAADSGVKVLVVDEQPILGGSLSYHRFDSEGVLADQLRANLIEKIEANDNISVLLNATCNAWFTDNYLPVIQGKRMFKVRAKECIVASGAFEQHVVFRNNDLPGVVMSSAANRMMKLYAVKPGQRAVVLTGNDDGYLTAVNLDDNGIKVAAVIDMRTAADDISLADELKRRGINVKLGSTVYEAIPADANKHVVGADVRMITGRGKVANEGELIDCDLLCMSAGYMPTYQLLCQAGAKLAYDDEAAEFTLSNLPDHLHIAGSVNGIHTLQSVVIDGEQAAISALHNLGVISESPMKVTCNRKVNYEWPIFTHPKGKDFVDFDEDLQTKDIVNATRLGYRDVQLVKRFSTVGMGPSQGRHSALPTARLVADSTQRTVTETGVTTARPPFSPEKLAHVAGRGFEPYRRTAMHYRHLSLSAHMVPVGNWQRPAFYGDASQRDAIVHKESQHVRTKVGCIDVSTLGGIELQGPDAVELLNRLYTADFTKQRVGKMRYGAMLNEHGVLMEEGMIVRISETHFYITASTSGVDKAYREMTKWNVQWRLNVDISNVTSAFSAINLAGPDARKVLQELVSDTDISAQALPFMAYTEALVKDIPARLLRVGFVGELSYEIHVPTLYGEALWDALMTAGKAYDIKPFGVDTQRLLRLEKAHLILGQDTDGMSHPGELSMEWALDYSKSFFVGRRATEIVIPKKQTRKLVFFQLSKDHTKPEEGHLVLDGDDISGNITSCEFSPTMDAVIGIAYVAPHQSKEGSRIPIRVEGAEVVHATVVAPPFYDPENKRQEL